MKLNYKLTRRKNLVLLNMAILSLALLMTIIQSVCTQTKPDENKSLNICNALSEIVADEKAPGIIAAIISGEGVIAIGSAGVRKAGSDVIITDKDIVHLGSCTKAMTCVMLATLVAEGKLGWDMKLIEAIPELKESIHPDYNNITLWQLLTHRAGISTNPIDWDTHYQLEIKERRLAILKENLSKTPSTKKGEFNYSNFGYVIATCMAEKITGLSWESLMKKRLFEPLGMSSAGFGESDTGKSLWQPWGHSKSGGKWEPSRFYDAEAIGPAGEIHCSIEDWAKFISLQLTGKNLILDNKYLKRLSEPVGFYAGGWGITEDVKWAKGKVLTHNGSNGIWYATVFVAPKIDRAYVVVTNSNDFSSTGDICSKMITKLIKLDLNTN